MGPNMWWWKPFLVVDLPETRSPADRQPARLRRVRILAWIISLAMAPDDQGLRARQVHAGPPDHAHALRAAPYVRRGDVERHAGAVSGLLPHVVDHGLKGLFADAADLLRTC